MNELIDQIAIEAANTRYCKSAVQLLSELYLSLPEAEKGKKPSPQRAKELEQQLRDAGTIESPPRLLRQEIDEITLEHPYHLPQEFYDLYQRGNGGFLPIGIGDRDWSSYDNYFMYTHESSWLTLQDSMCAYKYELPDIRVHWPHLLPIVSAECSIGFIEGTNTQQKTSRVYRCSDINFYDKNSTIEIIYDSMAEMIADRLNKFF